MKYPLLYILTGLVFFSCQRKAPDSILNFESVLPYIEDFNEGDNELYVQYIPNDSAAAFLEAHIPLVDLPDEQLEKIYYFRWWTYRKHIKSTPAGFIITEFLPEVSWAGKYNAISCPAGHQVYEGRWLRDPQFMEDYLHFWLTEAEDDIRSYSFWVADAFLAHSKVNRRDSFIGAHLPRLIDNYTAWEREKKDAPERLFWQIDNRDGMEFSASGRILNGGDRVNRMAAIRPTINSYMYGDALAIATMSSLLGNEDIATDFKEEAAAIKSRVQQRLWNDSLAFFTVMPRDYDDQTEPLDIRELIGYVPWYFNLPDDHPEYALAWPKVLDTTGFFAPHGLTVCEQTHPYFEVSYEGHPCQWNGPSWPFATTQTLKALANFLNDYENNGELNKEDYYKLLRQYADSHTITFENGDQRPWIDENLHPYTGDWIARTRLKPAPDTPQEKNLIERGKDYNHSGFCDLIISDLIGFKPQLNGNFTVQPLVPDTWQWFCLDKVLYNGKSLTILWDEDGSRYGRGAGFRIFYDNQLVGASDEVKTMEITL